LNPNAAVEALRSKGMVQDVLYSRFIERVIDVGAFGEIEALREYWKENAASAAEQAPAAQKAA
jgi:hypothetical protein